MQIHSTSVPNIKTKIFSILQSEKQRFKWGKEVKKKTTLYALRSNVPPTIPPFNIPISGQITDVTIRQICESNRRVKFIPNASTSNTNWLASFKIILCTSYNILIFSKLNGVQFPREVTYCNLKSATETTSPTKSNNVSNMADGKLVIFFGELIVV